MNLTSIFYFVNPSNDQILTSAHPISVHVMKMLFVSILRGPMVVYANRALLEMVQPAKVSVQSTGG